MIRKTRLESVSEKLYKTYKKSELELLSGTSKSSESL